MPPTPPPLTPTIIRLPTGETFDLDELVLAIHTAAALARTQAWHAYEGMTPKEPPDPRWVAVVERLVNALPPSRRPESVSAWLARQLRVVPVSTESE